MENGFLFRSRVPIQLLFCNNNFYASQHHTAQLNDDAEHGGESWTEQWTERKK